MAEPTEPVQVELTIREIINAMVDRLGFTFTKSQILDAFEITEKMREDELLVVNLDILEQHLRSLYGLPGGEAGPQPDGPSNEEEAAHRCSGFRVRDGVVTHDPCKVKGAAQLRQAANGLFYCGTHIKQGDVDPDDPREKFRRRIAPPLVEVELASENPRRVANIHVDSSGEGTYPSLIPGDEDVKIGKAHLEKYGEGGEFATTNMPLVSYALRQELDALLRQFPDYDPSKDNGRVAGVRNKLILGELDINTFSFRDSDQSQSPSSSPRSRRGWRRLRGGGRRQPVTSTEKPPGDEQATLSELPPPPDATVLPEPPATAQPAPAEPVTPSEPQGDPVDKIKERIQRLFEFLNPLPATELHMPNPETFVEACAAMEDDGTIDPDDIREIARAVLADNGQEA